MLSLVTVDAIYGRRSRAQRVMSAGSSRRARVETVRGGEGVVVRLELALELVALGDVTEADALVARRIEELDLPTYPVSPADAYVAVHEDAAGAPRVVFVMNPTRAPLSVKVALRGVRELAEAWPNEGAPTIRKQEGAFEVEVRKRTIRIFRVVS